MIDLNIFKLIKIRNLKEKHRRLLNESHLYSTMNRKKSDELFKQATEIENKILELKNK